MGDAETFLEVFGHFTIADAAKLLTAIGFLIYTAKKIREFLKKKKELMIAKHEAEKEKDKQLHEALDAVKKYPEYRRQSLEIQKTLKGQIQELGKSQEAVMKRLELMEENINRRERNKLRDRLLQSYRYFTSEEHNPLQAWTRMESEAFWDMFKDYEDVNGNGYVHTEVQPIMNKLDVIEMADTERVIELMKSRG